MKKTLLFLILAAALVYTGGPGGANVSHAASANDCSAIPPFVNASAPPMVMLVMGRNHKLYYEAYNDASDLDEDGLLDVGYNTNITYYGYFDSYKCYTYDTDKFVPVSTTEDKTCSGQWSGDFLNYLTMSRMDALRKVLYGGYRSTDTTDETVLERVFIPQDAHSWGKEYTGADEDLDGYDISDYTPISSSLDPGERHLFATTTLTGNDSPPMLRVMQGNSHRIWEWVAKERPVCDDSLAEYGSTGHPGHPSDHDDFEVMVAKYSQEKYEFLGADVGSKGEPFVDDNGNKQWDDGESYTDENNNDAYDDDWERPHSPAPANLGSDGQIAGKGNPWGPHWDPYSHNKPDQENYMAIFTGSIVIENEGDYQFAVNGDDAVEFIIADDTGTNRILGWYGGHGTCNSDGGQEHCNDHSTFTDGATSIHLSAGAHQISFRMEEKSGGDKYFLLWNGPDSSNAWELVPPEAFDTDGDDVSNLEMHTYTLTPPVLWEEGIQDYIVRVEVCKEGLLESNCKAYINGSETTYKPIGLLQRHGESDRMVFGLVSGSNEKNTSGGVLRKKMSSIKTEINPYTGQFIHNMDAGDVTTLNADASQDVTFDADGIVNTIDTFRIVGFNYSGKKYDQNCGWIASRPINTGECRMWGNPVGEMMYEALRYFNGKAESTSQYVYAGSDDDGLDLPHVTSWDDPYQTYPKCAKPFMLVISDISPTFDSDELPGVYSWPVDEDEETPPEFPGDLDLSVDELADGLSAYESDVSGNHFIGQMDDDYDGSCSVKNLDGLGGLRGLCPDEPTKQGSYYSASVAWYGRKTDLFPDDDDWSQYVNTYSVGLASPLPRIRIPVGVYAETGEPRIITLVPFAKSVGGYSISTDREKFQPTNTIVDFFVDTLDPEMPAYGKFRINYEDVEQGADHDMDAIIIYEYQVLKANGDPVEDSTEPGADNTRNDGAAVEITLTSEYAAGSIKQHCGYIISGTTTDGTYLEVRDVDTSEDSDPDYFLDTPPGDLCLDECVMGADGKLVEKPNWSDNPQYVSPYLRTGDEDNYVGVFNPAIGPNMNADDTNWEDGKPLPLIAVRRFTPNPDPPDSGDDSEDTGDDLVDTTAELLKNPLWYAAKWGGFVELTPKTDDDEEIEKIPELQKEWDNDEDGVPDTYFYVVNPLRLEEQLEKSFNDILRRTSSGTAASVISSTRSGEGSLFQSIFFPWYEDDIGNSVNWIGQLHALFMDSMGNIREDTNQNGLLDETVDRIIRFSEDDEGDLAVGLYEDSDGDFDPDSDEANETLKNLFQIKYIWSSTPWLNTMSDTNVVEQRDYTSSEKKRYIFTFLNSGETGVPAGGDVVDFVSPSIPDLSDLTDTGEIYPYIHVSESFDDTPQDLQNLKATNPDLYNMFLRVQSKRVIDYIRGEDQPALDGDNALTVEGSDDTWKVPAFRSRQVDYNDDKVAETWRLGDVVYSSPSVAARPAEAYHLMYGDMSYATFLEAFSKRRAVVYMGANDGMLHAFNAGFYSTNKKGVLSSPCDDPCKSPTGTNCSEECDLTLYDCTKCDEDAVGLDLGAELWAYIPYNLLPHLYWLTMPEYGENLHVYYNDLKPKLFDAKILPDDTHYTDSDDDPNWGTILVAGMRFGGCEIQADMDKTDGFTVDADEDRTMSSAFVIMDVTDPENPPNLLGEINFPDLGYTTCYPAVIPMLDMDLETDEIEGNDWYLIFGSGPATADGSAGPPPVLAADGEGAVSSQKGRLYILNLNKLVMDKEIWTVAQGGTLTAGLHTFQVLDSDDASFISRLVTVDWDLNYNADATYFGTVSGDTVTPGGKLRRVVYDFQGDDPTDPGNWKGDKVMLDLTSRNQPIVAAPNASMDNEGESWVYVGTGRYYTNLDVENTDRQTMYGVKEPWDEETDDEGNEIKLKNYEEVLLGDLLDVTDIYTYDDGSVTGLGSGNTAEALLDAVGDKDGWKMDFEQPGERNLGIASVYAQMIIFTTFLPSANICEIEGESFLYALYYQTGTSVLRGGFLTGDGDSEEPARIEKAISLGSGMAIQATPKPPSKDPVKGEAGIIIQTNNAGLWDADPGVTGWTHSDVAKWRDLGVVPDTGEEEVTNP